MATVVSDELTSQVTQLYTGTDKFYALLITDPGATFNASSSYADVIENEIDPDIGGYLRQEFSYTSTDINSYNNGVSVDAKRVTFTHSGTPTTDWTISHVAVVRAPGARSTANVKPIWGEFSLSATDVDITLNRITVDASDYSNFVDGDQVTIYGYQNATLPAGIGSNIGYYIKKVGTNQLELYTDPLLSTIVDITGTSSGTGYIRNASGILFGVYQLASTTSVAGTQSIIYDISINQGQ